MPDLMELLQVSRNTIYRILGRGEMGFVKTGKRSIRVSPEAFEEWRREQGEASKKKGPPPAKVEAPDPQKGSARGILPD